MFTKSVAKTNLFSLRTTLQWCWRVFIVWIVLGLICSWAVACVHLVIDPPRNSIVDITTQTIPTNGRAYAIFPPFDVMGPPPRILNSFKPDLDGHWERIPVGWPTRSWAIWYRNNTIGVGIPLPYQWILDEQTRTSIPAALPILPASWVFLVESLAWSVFLRVSTSMSIACRARHRLRRHRCPRCTYDLSATVFNTNTSAHLKTPSCPECNWQPRTKTRNQKSRKTKRTSSNEPTT